MKDKWIHIGDDFMKDIVGAKELQMRSIWCRELVKGKEQSFVSKNGSDGNDTTANEDTNKSNLEKDLADKKVVKMIIGSEDFLMTSIQSEFADAIVDEFQDVGKVLSEWHLEGLAYKNNINEVAETNLDEVKDLFTIIVPDTSESTKETETPNENIETKFCVMCGTKLPKVAKFCSSCGNEQPSIL